MILVNIRQSGEAAVTPDQIRDAAAGDWVVGHAALDAGYADVLLAVRRNQVLGAYTVRSWEDVADGRIRFDLEESQAYAGLVGGASPVPWKRGQVNPVQYVETEDVPASSTSARPSGDGPDAGHGGGEVLSLAAPTKPRRGVHRITIETKGLDDESAARLHHALITMAASTGALHDYRSTSLVREMAAAKEANDFSYKSAPSPRAQRD